jgi:hypothetical protein
MICLLAIFHVSLPACDPFSQRRRFVFGPYDAQQELRCCHCHADCHLPQPRSPAIGPSRHRSAQTKAYNACRRLHRPKGAHRDPSRHRSAQIKAYGAHCHLPQARLPAIGPSRHRSAQIKAYSAYRRLHDARELTEIHPLTRNATAQPGRSWPRCREAFLSLAKSYRMKGMPRASLHCGSHGRSIAVRIVMVRRRGGGSELSSCSYLGQCGAIQRNDRRRDSHEHRIQSGRSRRIEGSGFKPAVPSRIFSCEGVF